MTDRRLSDVEFEDIYLPASPGAPVLVRRLRERDTPFAAAVSGVVGLPEAFRADAERLRLRLLETWRAEGAPNEFSLLHDGAGYRAARIPADARSGAAPDPARDTWCLRRLARDLGRLDDLGLPRDLVETLRALGRSRGLLLVSGMFGSGKTSTASICLRDWALEAGEVAVTLEDPPETPIASEGPDGAVYQVRVSEGEIALGVRAARRWGPRYVMIGDIHDGPTAREAVRLALSGPMVIAPIHAKDPVQTVMNLVSFASDEMEPELARNMVADALQAVLHLDRRGGRFHPRFVQIAGHAHFLRRTMIRLGRYDGMAEAFGLEAPRQGQLRQA